MILVLGFWFSLAMVYADQLDLLVSPHKHAPRVSPQPPILLRIAQQELGEERGCLVSVSWKPLIQ